MAYRNAGLCKYPGGCPYSIRSGGLCEHHMPTKPIVKKSDKCRSCGRVFRVDVRVIRGVCNLVVARKKNNGGEERCSRNMLHTGL
jgi:hypothetical protein